MNRERLFLLRAHMAMLGEEIASGNTGGHAFDMNNWFVASEDQCHTACCLLGEATRIPEFAAAGLFVNRARVMSTLVDATGCLQRFRIQFEDDDGFNAGLRFFDLTEREAAYLFYPEHYSDLDGIELDEQGELDDDASRKIVPADCVVHIDNVLRGENVVLCSD